jgi:hypothetical protein
MKRAILMTVLAGVALEACAPTQRPSAAAPAAAPAPGQVIPVSPSSSSPPQASAAPAPAQTPASVTPAPAPASPPKSGHAAAPAKASKPKPASAAGQSAATASKAQAAQAETSSAPAVASATVSKPATPSLDLGSLEQKLRETKAIGVFTKLSLKNQVDDLLDEVRQYHQSPGKTPQPVIRQQFEGLMLKVLSSLQAGDPQLANTIASSREALWGILMDPVKFSKI